MIIIGVYLCAAIVVGYLLWPMVGEEGAGGPTTLIGFIWWWLMTIFWPGLVLLILIGLVRRSMGVRDV